MSSAPITIRPATVADVSAIVRHRRLMFESMGETDTAKLDAASASSASYLAAALASGDYRGWLAVAPKGEVVGGGGLVVLQTPGRPNNLSGKFSYLLSVFVEPEYRRQGIARRIVQTMIDWSRDQGIAQVSLQASDMGRPMYEEMGFKATHDMRLMLE